MLRCTASGGELTIKRVFHKHYAAVPYEVDAERFFLKLYSQVSESIGGTEMTGERTFPDSRCRSMDDAMDRRCRSMDDAMDRA